MYRPPAFRVDDSRALYEMIAQHPLATLITAGDDGIRTTQIPMIAAPDHREGLLIGHIARANPQWRSLSQGGESVALFTGERHYISPEWYASTHEHGRTVPTYDYIVVEARGSVRVVHELAELREFVIALSDREERRIGGAWSAESLSSSFMDAQLAAVVGIEFQVASLSGSFKLSQNHSERDIGGVVSGLRALGEASATSIASMIASAAIAAGGEP